MDFCIACRRPLNGAYSCPDCGTVADRPAPPDEGDTEQLPLVTDQIAGAESPQPGDSAPVHASGGSAPMAFSREEPRRKRSRRARQQRAVVYAIGTVALAGALTLFALATFSGGSSGGTPAPPGIAELPPAPPTGTPTSGDVSPTAAGAPRHSHPASPSVSASPSATASQHSVSPSSSRHSGRHPTTPARTARPTATRTTAGPPPVSSPPTTSGIPRPPSPGPTKSCAPVLWWCN